MTEEKGIKYILFEELLASEGRGIAEQTGAETLVLNPAQTS
jgi:hypothetical protein